MIPRGFVKIPKAELGHAARELIKEKLTVFPLGNGFNASPDPVRLWAEDQTHLGVARGAFNEVIKKRFDPSFVFDFSPGSQTPKAIPYLEQYRDGQLEVINETVDYLKSFSFAGAIIEAQVSAGKTVLGIEIAKRLGLKTLVVVHNTVLLEQWTIEIKKFAPDWSVGRVQGECVDVHNNDICVGMLQSLSMKDDYPESLYREFGLIICDEIHLMASKEFSKLFTRFCPKYIVGLSGTLKRADKAENVFIHSTGKVIKAIGKINTLVPTIYFVDTKFVVTKLTKLDRYSFEKNGMLKEMMDDPARNHLIIKYACDAARKGRHVLILSERVAHVDQLYSKIYSSLVKDGITVGKMVGSSSKEERENAQTKQIIVATVQLLSVGFNAPRLDTLIFASPVQSGVQAVGRVIRQHPDKKNPMVIDLYESSSAISKRLAISRKRRYLEKGWMVKNL